MTKYISLNDVIGIHKILRIFANNEMENEKISSIDVRVQTYRTNADVNVYSNYHK